MWLYLQKLEKSVNRDSRNCEIQNYKKKHLWVKEESHGMKTTIVFQEDKSHRLTEV